MVVLRPDEELRELESLSLTIKSMFCEREKVPVSNINQKNDKSTQESQEWSFWDRLKENLRPPSAIYDHDNTSGHGISVNNFSIVSRQAQRVNDASLNKNLGKFQTPYLGWTSPFTQFLGAHSFNIGKYGSIRGCQLPPLALCLFLLHTYSVAIYGMYSLVSITFSPADLMKPCLCWNCESLSMITYIALLKQYKEFYNNNNWI